MNNRKQNIPKRIIWLPDILLILAGILLDQFTKHLAVVYLKGKPACIPDTRSPGTAVPGKPRRCFRDDAGEPKVFFLIITPVILAAVIYALIKMPSDGKIPCPAYLAGLCGCGGSWKYDRPYQTGLCGGFHLYQSD